MEPKDLDAIPKEETTATHLKVIQQRRRGVEPEDLDVKPKKETTAHPWSTSDSVKRPGS